MRDALDIGSMRPRRRWSGRRRQLNQRRRIRRRHARLGNWRRGRGHWTSEESFFVHPIVHHLAPEWVLAQFAHLVGIVIRCGWTTARQGVLSRSARRQIVVFRFAKERCVVGAFEATGIFRSHRHIVAVPNLRITSRPLPARLDRPLQFPGDHGPGISIRAQPGRFHNAVSQIVVHGGASGKDRRKKVLMKINIS